MALLSLDSRFCAVADGEITAPSQFAEIRRVVRRYLDLPRIIDTRPLFGTAPFDECLPSITMRLDRAVMTAAEHVFQCLRSCVAQLSAVAGIAAIASTHQCHVSHLISDLRSRQEC